MKKLLFALVLLAIGSGTWWMVARSPRFSARTQDVKFENALRHSLSQVNVGNQDILSSVHEIKKDKNGDWVSHRIQIKMRDGRQKAELRRLLERSGAQVEEAAGKSGPVFLVKKGGRVYQEVQLIPSH